MKALIVYLALAVLTLGVFALWPELDLIVAHYFFHAGDFFGRTASNVSPATSSA